jgi:tRNA-intron endonuclease
MENNREESYAICNSILFTIENGKSAQYIHSKYNMGVISGRNIILKPFELLFLYYRNRLKPVNPFYNDSLTLVNTLFEENDLYMWRVYLDLKNEGSKISIENEYLTISKKNEKLSVKRIIYPIREKSRVDESWLISISGQNIASVDDDGDITYYTIDMVNLEGNNRPELPSVTPTKIGNRGIQTKDMKPDWMGDHLEDIVILSEGEMNYINGLENSDPVSRVYKELISNGLIVKTGFKYGCNFRAYRGSMDDHSDFLIHVLEREVEWYEISRAVRLAASVRKEMIFATIHEEKSYFIRIKRIKNILEMNLRD